MHVKSSEQCRAHSGDLADGSGYYCCAVPSPHRHAHSQTNGEGLVPSLRDHLWSPSKKLELSQKAELSLPGTCKPYVI